MTETLFRSVIGRRIRAARRAADLTLEEIARRMGISNQALSAIERGRRNPSKQTLMNLARVLRNDFGEKWLEEYLSEHQADLTLSYAPRLDFAKENLMQLFKEFLDNKYGSDQVEVIGHFEVKGTLLPISHEITESGLTSIDPIEEYIIVPPQMVPSDKGATATVVKGLIMRDAFVKTGDIVVITERPRSISGKQILAFVNGEFIIKRCKLKGRKVTLIPIVDGFDTTTISIKEIEWMAEVTGVIRLA